MFRSFKGPDGQPWLDAPPGKARLIFSLFVDWFNPFGNKTTGKSASVGAIYMVCMNLPIHLWYCIIGKFTRSDGPSFCISLIGILFSFWLSIPCTTSSRMIYHTIVKSCLGWQTRAANPLLLWALMGINSSDRILAQSWESLVFTLDLSLTLRMC